MMMWPSSWCGSPNKVARRQLADNYARTAVERTYGSTAGFAYTVARLQ